MLRGYENLFVGSVSVILGLLMIVAAVSNSQWVYSLGTARFLQRHVGRIGTRLFHMLLGVGLVALGVAVACGYRWPLIGP